MTLGKYTLLANPFWGGVLFPTVVIGFLYFWPWFERRLTGDDAFHNLLERPRDNPLRTGVGVGMLVWVVLVFVAGSSDRVNVLLNIPYDKQIWFYRVAVFVVPIAAGLGAARVCTSLQRGERVERERRKAEAAAVQPLDAQEAG